MPRWPAKPKPGYVVPGIDADADGALLRMSDEAVALALSLAGLPGRHRDTLSDVTLALARACYLEGIRDAADTMYTLRQVAAQLGLAEVTVKQRAQKRGIGRQVHATQKLYSREDVDNLAKTYAWGEWADSVRVRQPSDEWQTYYDECNERALEHHIKLTARKEERMRKIRLAQDAAMAAEAARSLEE